MPAGKLSERPTEALKPVPAGVQATQTPTALHFTKKVRLAAGTS